MSLDGNFASPVPTDWSSVGDNIKRFVDLGLEVLLVTCIQYCRVPKNGLPKNGQAGISPKFKNVLRLEK